MDRVRQAREQIWTAIVEAGGPYAVARRAGLHPTHLYGWRRGDKAISEGLLASLRRQIPDVSDATWGAALVAPPDPQPEAASA